MKLIECVPNFSEGQNPNTIGAITHSINEIKNIKILSVEPGYDANRTVITFVGPPEDVKSAAFNSIKTAANLIDMRLQKGKHPRIGATDVFPFIPLFDTSMHETLTIADEVAREVGSKLNIPVYLYESSAKTPERKNLANIRKGEYERLKEKLSHDIWKPDYGPANFNSKSGATVIGARNILIAYNINLSSKDTELATLIAQEIRESGKITVKPHGNKIKSPGLFKGVKAIGWFIKEYNIAQVSINITDYQIAPLHEIYETTKKLALKYGTTVTGSELIGLIPKSVLLQAGMYYLKIKETYLPEKEIIQHAIDNLGLNDLDHFDREKKIIEYALIN